jgi:hypothetical protein
LWGCIGNSIEIITVQAEKYTINICKPEKEIQIGCARHSIKDWLEFSDSEISEMDLGALKWWNDYKELIKMHLKLNGMEV